LLKRDPERPQALRDLSISLYRLGGVQEARGDLVGALASFAESLAIRRRLLTRDPELSQAQKDLSSGLKNLAGVLEAQGDRAAPSPRPRSSSRVVPRRRRSRT